MALITKPELPPRDGYVEDIDPVTGEHIYIPTEETRRYQELQKENGMLNAKIKAITEQSDFLEECIVEMAMLVYDGV